MPASRSALTALATIVGYCPKPPSRAMGACDGGLGDAGDPGRGVAVEDGGVLGQGDAVGGRFQAGEVEVLGAPFGVVELGPAHLEGGPQLHQGQHPPLAGVDIRGRACDGIHPAQLGGAVASSRGAP